jgi:hypothetical protein
MFNTENNNCSISCPRHRIKFKTRLDEWDYVVTMNFDVYTDAGCPLNSKLRGYFNMFGIKVILN